eukprot:1558961-Pyramimonas_sp.AAC.1
MGEGGHKSRKNQRIDTGCVLPGHVLIGGRLGPPGSLLGISCGPLGPVLGVLRLPEALWGLLGLAGSQGGY